MRIAPIAPHVQKLFCASLLLGALLAAQSAPAFAPLQRWEAAVRQGDAAALAQCYSTQPPPSYLASTGLVTGSQDETTFWGTLAQHGLRTMAVDLIANQALTPSLRQIYFQAALDVNTARGSETFYLFVQQTWLQEGSTWRIVGGNRTGLSRLKQPESLDENIYSKGADAHADIAAALKLAAVQHKRVLLDFGGNWCYDCHVLADAFRSSQFAPLLQSNYIVVDIDVENFDYNLDIASRYQVPLQKGVPALAVLDSNGKLLMSQQNGEFESARKLSPDDLIAFLTQWKPGPVSPKPPLR